MSYQSLPLNKLTLAIAFIGALFPSISSSKDNQTVIINGQIISKFVNKITFEDDVAKIAFEDGTVEKDDISSVYMFYQPTPSDIDGVKNLKVASKKSVSNLIFNLQGNSVGNSLKQLSKGVYITDHHKIIVK